MGLGDFFRASENKKLIYQSAALNAENERLKNEVENLLAKNKELEIKLTPDHYLELEAKVDRLKKEMAEIQSDISALNDNKEDIKGEINRLIDELSLYEKDVNIAEYCVYNSKYDFESSDLYAEKLNEIKAREKAMITVGTAATCGTNWTIYGSREKGLQMERDTIKLLLRAFNNECDGYIRKVTHSNVDTTEKRITTAYNVISKLAKVNDITINQEYFELKKEELYLAYEFACKKQEEKEAAKEERARLREQAKLQKEIEEARKKLQKEREHYQAALTTIEHQLEEASGELRDELISKRDELKAQIEDNDTAMKDVDYREANHRAGYVYVISNIGAFGENVFKIGMTRRLDPMDRVDELGDASVPFEFDVHAMIFSNDAPALEAALHRAFESKKLNMINKRREFFNVTLEEIKEVVRQNFDKTVEFVDYPAADQYRASQKMRVNSGV